VFQPARFPQFLSEAVGLLQQVHGHVPDHGHVPGRMTGAQAVLDPPIAADDMGEGCRSGLVEQGQ
jgi:hypothetical protein